VSTLNCSDAHPDERRPTSRRTLLAAAPIYKLIVIYKQRPNNGAACDHESPRPAENHGAPSLVERVKSSRKLKSFRENYERHGKPRAR